MILAKLNILLLLAGLNSNWLYIGFSFSSITVDNSTIGFQLLIIIIFPLIHWIAKSESKTNQYNGTFILLLLCIYLCFLLNSLLLFFIFYELLIIVLFFMLYIFIPSYYRIRTAFFLFLFSILGSINFILSCVFIISSFTLFSLLIIMPFLIKIPSFPFIIDYQKYIVKLIHQYHYIQLLYY